jgi:hypothetical protein
MSDSQARALAWTAIGLALLAGRWQCPWNKPTPNPDPPPVVTPDPPGPVLNSSRLVIVVESTTRTPEEASVLLTVRQWCLQRSVPLWIVDRDSVGPDDQQPPDLVPYLRAVGDQPLPAIARAGPSEISVWELPASSAAVAELLARITAE